MSSFFLICDLKNAREHGVNVLIAQSSLSSPIASAFLPVTRGMPKAERINVPGSLIQPNKLALHDIFCSINFWSSQNKASMMQV